MNRQLLLILLYVLLITGGVRLGKLICESRHKPAPPPTSVWFRVTNSSGMSLTLEVPRKVLEVEAVFYTNRPLTPIQIRAIEQFIAQGETNRPGPPGGLRANP